MELHLFFSLCCSRYTAELVTALYNTVVINNLMAEKTIYEELGYSV
jgi:hypothetical protein